MIEANVFVALAVLIPGILQTLYVRRAVALDGWYTLLGGRIVSSSGIPRHDALTVLSHGHTWVDQQWFGQLSFYGLWSAGGWGLAIAAVVAMYVAAFAVVASEARLGGASERSTAVVVAVCIATGVSNTVLRAQIPAYLLCAVVLALLLGDRRRPGRRVLLVFPLLALWANIHGSVLLGAGLVTMHGLATAAERRRAGAPLRSWAGRAAMFVVLPWPCTLASPYAGGLPGYYRYFTDNKALQHVVSEWAPSTIRGQPMFFAVLGLSLLVLFRQRTAIGLFGWAALLATGFGGLLAARNIVWFSLVAAALLPRGVDELVPAGAPLAPRRVRLNLGLAVAAAATLLLALSVVTLRERSWFEFAYPRPAAAAVAAAVAQDPAARVFADERYADWLLFVEPSLAGRGSFDLRYELLSDQELARIASFERGAGADWQAAVTGYRLLVLEPREQAVGYFRQHGARTLFSDGHVVVLLRPRAESRP